jgi:glycosyltransferase involved in cell wall biosynthesis
MDRLAKIESRLDSDPRIASVSVVFHPSSSQDYLRACAPAGSGVAIALDTDALLGGLTSELIADGDAEKVSSWARAASERGLWHDWWLTGARDVAKAGEFISTSKLDKDESKDLASSRSVALDSGLSDTSALTLTIDATWLGPHQTGAQVLTTAAIEALAGNASIASINLIGLDELPEYAAHLVENDAVCIGPAPERTEVIWYPNQIDQRVDISQARSLGRRVITTYLDLIAYDIPRYHASDDAWGAYRSLQRRIALSVDGITTISADVARRLIEEVPRLNRDRILPIPLGLDHIYSGNPQPGSDLHEIREALTDRPFVLVLGNDFQHKNRDFAIRVWEKVLDAGVNCDLVLAGLHVKSSSSKASEDALLAQHTNLRGRAHVVGHVSSESREWLLAEAAAVLYPSSAEGFGFVPYEAAALGTPSTFTAFGPLAEISGVQNVPSSWSVEDHAEDLIALLNDPERAQKRVIDLRTAIARSTWDSFAASLVDFARKISDMPPVEGALTGGGGADAAALAGVLNSKTWRATSALRSAGKRMMGRR